MPLNSPEDYDRLGEHLAQLDPLLTAFAAQHGYTVYPKLSRVTEAYIMACGRSCPLRSPPP